MFRKWRVAAALLAGSSLLVANAAAETVAVIGTGHVGAALGQRFAELGHEIVYGSREPERASVEDLVAASGPSARAMTQDAAVQDADIVVFAVPWEIVEDLTRDLGDLAGKIIIDPTNPRRIAEDGLRDYPFDGSNAERIQALAPDAHVVKAFSTLGTETMLDPSIAGGPVSVPIAGDDARAKRVVAELVAGIGLEPVDVGPLRYAHVIEGLHYLRNNAGEVGDSRINFYFPADPTDAAPADRNDAAPAEPTEAAPALPPPLEWTTEQDHQDMRRQLGIAELRPGPSGREGAPNAANYDESPANPFPDWPSLLTLSDGTPVTSAETWWDTRRPQIVEAFEREVVGRVPADAPRVGRTGNTSFPGRSGSSGSERIEPGVSLEPVFPRCSALSGASLAPTDVRKTGRRASVPLSA